MRGTRGMFTRIPGNLLEGSGECYNFNIRGMFKKIPGNVQGDSEEYSKRGFRGMLKKISGNLNLDLFCEILLTFYQILQLNRDKTK